MSDEELIEYAETVQTEKTKNTDVISSFPELLLKDELIKAIRDANLEHPSAVQQQVIPKAVLGADIICQAKSGTGKTVVFVLSALQRINAEDVSPARVQVMAVANTKEMVVQIANEFRRFMSYTDLKVEMVFGGVDVNGDVEKLKARVDVVVGTPGRLFDLIQRGALDVSALRILIIDEVDSILSSLSSRWTVQRIIYRTPVAKQTMLFTATLSNEMKSTCLLMVRNPFVLQVDEERKLTLHGLEQGYVNVIEDNKRDKLIGLIDSIRDISQCVIFCRDKRRVEVLCEHLKTKGLPAVAITSDYDTNERMQRFMSFKNLNYRFLVTTNLMARGIDIAEINLVVNYDMAEDAQTYLHRVGRAGRFETRGTAVSFICNEEDIVVLNEVQERFEVSIKEIK
ncbi:ATP-dependent RNA helicase [Trachipleistophora hominis]|uniref:RNA helicase n=1 Tax=Trachipleistophora hominis TaxID=72359 RepID=L7JZT1_TRAHO|nr:ATP-dependent RNA helicase [Trachipleistophora hominis]